MTCSVSRCHGLRPSEVPAQRSTSVSSPRTTANAAPRSDRCSTFSANAARTRSKPAATRPSTGMVFPSGGKRAPGLGVEEMQALGIDPQPCAAGLADRRLRAQARDHATLAALAVGQVVLQGALVDRVGGRRGLIEEDVGIHV